MEKQVSISVLPPTVVNESHPLQNVALEDLDEVILGDEIPIPDVNIDYQNESGK